MAEEPSFAERVRQRNQEFSGSVTSNFAAQARMGSIQEEGISPLSVAQQFASSITGQESLEGPGLSFGERARMSLLGDTPEERQAAFTQQFPEGEFLPIPTSDISIFRRNREEPFQVADPSVSQAFSEGRLMGETVRDIADIAGDLPEIAGEALLMGLGRGRGKQAVEVGKGAFQASRGFLNDMMRLFAGGAGGSQAQQAGQTLAGTQRQDIGEQTQQSIGEGSLSVVGGTLGDVAGRGINVVRGGGFVRRTPEGLEAQQAAKDIGMEGSLPVSATTDNPVIRLAARQSGALTTKIGRELRAFNENLTNVLTSKSNPADRARFTKRGRQVLKEQNNELLKTVNNVMGRPGATLDEVGPVLQKAVDYWWHNTSKRHVDGLYDAARSIEAPRFNIETLQVQAQAITRRPTARGRPGDPSVQQSPILDPSGAPAREVEVPGAPGRNIPAGEVEQATERVAQKIAEIDPNKPVDVDFLRALRQEIYDSAVPGPNGERLLDARARRLRSAINDVMQNPRNTNPEFRKAWREADSAARSRFETRELTAVSQLLNTDKPVAAMRSIVRPGNFDSLVQLSRATKPSQFKQIGKAFQADLLRDPANAAKTLDNFSPKTRRLLTSEAEEKAIRDYSKAWNRLEDTQLRAAMDQQATTQSQIKEIINNRNTRGIEDFRKLIRDRGGMKSPFGKSVRAAIMQEVVDRAMSVTSGGAREISAPALRGVLKDFRESGALRLLPFEDAMFLSNAERVSNVLSTQADAGTALRAAQVTSGLLEFSGSAIGELVESLGVGRILTSEGGKRFLTGTATGRPIDLTTTRLMGGIANTIASDVEEEQQ